MRAFWIGFCSLVVLCLIAAVGFLLSPLFFVLGLILRVIFLLVFGILAIWLLGKIILFIWEKISPPDDPSQGE